MSGSLQALTELSMCHLLNEWVFAIMDEPFFLSSRVKFDSSLTEWVSSGLSSELVHLQSYEFLNKASITSRIKQCCTTCFRGFQILIHGKLGWFRSQNKYILDWSSRAFLPLIDRYTLGALSNFKLERSKVF